jgi:hypothetical protein
VIEVLREWRRNGVIVLRCKLFNGLVIKPSGAGVGVPQVSAARGGLLTPVNHFNHIYQVGCDVVFKAIALEVYRSSVVDIHDQTTLQRKLMLSSGWVFFRCIRVFASYGIDKECCVVTF